MMDSSGNSNPSFDMHKFFNSTSPNHSPIPPPSVPPSASYPPPSSGPFSYPPQTAPFHILHSHDRQHSLSFPSHALQPQSMPPPPPFPSSANAGAHLMALLNQESPLQPPPPPSSASSLGFSEFTVPSNLPVMPTLGVGMTSTGPIRMLSSKVPKGRHLVGDCVLYDVDARLQGELQPELEATTITKYGSDRQLVLGRQIAVNKSYICYGLKQGNIRVLNLNTALRSLLRGHTQRVTDLAFFAEDVHLLASVGIDGLVYVWKISEGPDEDDNLQINGRVVVAIQLVGEEEAATPRICWHCRKQEVLVVGMGKCILRIDTTKIGIGESYVAEEPLRCPVDKLINGVQLVGTHDREVTDLSMCQWMTNLLVSASLDGTIKIWEDCKAQPLAVLRPHDGHSVYSARFFTAPERPGHIVLITAGPLNCELKLWVSASEEGWLIPSDAEAWKCTQTLDMKSSAEPRIEEAFFNQIASLSQAGLLLLANAKRNAIYAVHLDYGPNPESTSMDYLAEFTLTMPILSFTGRSDILPHGEHIIQVYCVQTQAIQLYALDLAQCLPPPLENVALGKSDSTVSRDAITEGITSLDFSASRTTEISLSNSAPNTMIQVSSSYESAPEARYSLSSGLTEAAILKEISRSNTEAKSVTFAPVCIDADIVCVPSPPLPLSPRLSRKLSDFRSPQSNLELCPTPDGHDGDLPVNDYSVDMQLDTVLRKLSDVPPLVSDEKKVTQEELSSMLDPSVMFKQPTLLVTPFEIIKAVSSMEVNVTDGKSGREAKIQDVVVNSEVGNTEVELKVVREAKFNQSGEFCQKGQQKNLVSNSKEKLFCSQASDLGVEIVQECCAVSAETFFIDEPWQVDSGVGDSLAQPPHAGEDGLLQVSDLSTSTTASQLTSSNTKGKAYKGKIAHASGPSSSYPSTHNSTDLYNEPSGSTSLHSAETAFPQILVMQRTINQLLTMQKEMQKQMTMMVAVPVTKEGERLEAALGQIMEKAVKANTDALWARTQEENVKNEKLLGERIQQITSSTSNFMKKDLPAFLEKTVKKEMGAFGPAIVHAISPAIEKTISSAVVESFKRGVGDKAVNQLDKSVNSKIEATVARQIQAQFQTTGRQVLQEALKSSFETSVVPAFEMSCKAMFEQVDTTFRKGMIEHTTSVQQHLESGHTSLAMALRDAINSASSFNQSLSRELVEGQRKLIELAAAGANSSTSNPLPIQLNIDPLQHGKVEVSLDPTKELARLISECKYEEAFTGALQRSNLSIVSWLCSQVDLHGILSMVPLPLSQGVVLSLLQQLAHDINNNTPQKLTWMTDVAAAIDPTDQIIAMHVRPILEQVCQILNHQRSSPTMTGTELLNIRLLLHVINSMLMTCK